MGNLDAILKQYEKNSSNASKKMTNEERLKQYFTTFMKDGVNSLTKRVRILPVGEDESPFVEIMGHKTQLNGQWRTFICPQHEKDEPCPFCQAKEKLLATGEDGDKELAKKYNAKKMYVVKVIDRDHEDEGPKFWRFNHNWKKAGIFDKIFGVLQGVADSSAPDITDVENGRDLVINIARDSEGRPTVTSIVQKDPSPLSTNPELVEAWMADERTWKDVYSIKPYEYLKIIVTGGEPAWKKNENGEGGQWIDKTKEDESSDEEIEELTVGNDSSNEEVTSNNEETVTSGGEDDDLPF